MPSGRCKLCHLGGVSYAIWDILVVSPVICVLCELGTMCYDVSWVM